MKIRDLVVGSSTVITLLVKDSTILRTKPPGNKPYLSVDFFDGADTIKGVDWDYGDNPPLERNTVWEVSGQITEWAGNKQLKVTRLQRSDVGVEVFAPTGDVDVDYYHNQVKELIEQIENVHIQDITEKCFRDNWQLWKTIPSAKGMHHAFVAGNLKHSVDVALTAKALAELYGANVDLCVAGGLLQDLGKLWTYELNGAIIDMTPRGQMIEHIMIGAIKLEAYRTEENSKVLDLLQHIISSHHGQLEYGSPTIPMFMEAFIVSVADGADAKLQMFKEINAKTKPSDVYTEKAFALGNRPMFTQNYINSLLV